MKKLSLHVVIGFLLFFAGVAALLTMTYGGDLLRDISLSGQALEMHPTARVVSAKCTRYYFTVSACNTEYEHRSPGQPPVTNFQPKHEHRFLMFGSVAGERVMMMRPRSQSDAVTTSASMAHLGNRIATLLELLAICLITSIGLVVRYLRERTQGDVREDAPRELPASDVMSAGAQRLDEAMTRHIQTQARGRAPTVSGGPSMAGTFGRRGG